MWVYLWDTTIVNGGWGWGGGEFVVCGRCYNYNDNVIDFPDGYCYSLVVTQWCSYVNVPIEYIKCCHNCKNCRFQFYMCPCASSSGYFDFRYCPTDCKFYWGSRYYQPIKFNFIFYK